MDSALPHEQRLDCHHFRDRRSLRASIARASSKPAGDSNAGRATNRLSQGKHLRCCSHRRALFGSRPISRRRVACATAHPCRPDALRGPAFPERVSVSGKPKSSTTSVEEIPKDGGSLARCRVERAVDSLGRTSRWSSDDERLPKASVANRKSNLALERGSRSPSGSLSSRSAAQLESPLPAIWKT